MRVTDQATRVVPAGWYQDPALSEQVRWWNGLAWTEHVREKPNVVPAPVTEATVSSSAAQAVEETPAERIAAARELERQFGIGTSENEIITGATALGFGTGASASTSAHAHAAATPSPTRTPMNPAARQAAAGAAARRSGSHASSHTATGSAWLVALTPSLILLLGVAAAYLFFYVSSMPVVFVVAFVLPYLFGVLWALGDTRTLKARGVNSPGRAWALIGALGYLIVRRTRVSGSGPLAMFLVVGALVIGAPALAYASGSLHPLSDALTVQNTVSKEFIDQGRAVSVTCPPFADAATPGSLYTCTATTAIGVKRTIWVSIDGPDGEFSAAMSIPTS
jgi:hypothetical protein